MPKIIGDLKLYDIHELGKIMGITAITLRSYLRSGQLRGRKMGVTWYCTAEALREYFDGQTPDGQTPFSPRPATSSADKPQKQRKREGKGQGGR